MVDRILSENDQYNECFLLHSTLPHETDFKDGIRFIYGNDDTIKPSLPIGHQQMQR